MTDRLRQLLRYDVWANQETLRSLPRATAPARSVRWMAHIIGAELLWLDRMDGRTASVPVWPDFSVEESETRFRDLSSRLLDLLADGRTGPLSRPVSYTNSKGEAWTSTVEEILNHLVIHSAYHRGQIASDLRAGGFEPAYTDYIHAVRQGFIE